MGISSISEYVDFYLNLNMGKSVTLLSFANNEKLVLKQKLEYKNLKKEPIQEWNKHFRRIDQEKFKKLAKEAVLEKYRRNKKMN